ncbi:MAG: hypothetical protein LBM23_03900 [Propionibacteriaceae bacterium]|jgi:hypothetical protein|nr:hypothetical protein [Propionibacteriaceae bacterium]
MTRATKRILNLLLAILLALGIGLNPALAEGAQNSTAVEQLRELYGDQAAGYLAVLKQYGLIDAEGNLDLEQQVQIGDQSYDADELSDLLNDPETDLYETAYIGGQAVTLEQLKTMLDIETELSRIEETYFADDETLTDEQRASLESLHEQLGSMGLELIGEQVTDNPSGFNHYASITIDNTGPFERGEDPKVIVTLGTTLDHDISFDWRVIEGSAQAGADRELSGTPSGTATIKAGQQSITLPLDDLINALSDDHAASTWITRRWDGTRSFYVELSNLVDEQGQAFFSNDKTTLLDRVDIEADDPFVDPANTGATYYGTFIQDQAGTKTNFTSYPSTTQENLRFTADASWLVTDLDDAMRHALFEGTYTRAWAQTTLTGVTTAQWPLDPTSAYLGDSSVSTDPKAVLPDFDSYTMQQGDQGKFTWSAKTFDYSTSCGANNNSCPPWNYTKLWVANPGNGAQNYVSSGIRFYDETAPTVTGVRSITKADPLSYASQYFTPGQVIPITIDFSEPVQNQFCATENCPNTPTLTLNDGTVLRSTNYGVSDSLTFEYTVPLSDEWQVVITALDHVKAVSGVALADSSPALVALPDIALQALTKADAIDWDQVGIDVTMNADGSDHVVVTLPLTPVALADAEINGPLTAWMTNEAIREDTASGIRFRFDAFKLAAGNIDYPVTDIPVYSVNEEIKDGFTAEFDLPATAIQRTQSLEFYVSNAMQDSPNTPDVDDRFDVKLLKQQFATFVNQPVIPLTGEDFFIAPNTGDWTPGGDYGNYELTQDASDLSLLLRLTDTENAANATFKEIPQDFEVFSDDPSVAVVGTPTNGSYPITLTGAGGVTFGVVALNGDVPDADQPMMTFWVDVQPAPDTFLKFGAESAKVDYGQPYTAAWSSNFLAKALDADENATVDFTVDLLAKDSDEVLWTETVASSADEPAGSVQIPAEQLKHISTFGDYSYTVKVSATDPLTGTSASATQTLAVLASPAIIDLTTPENLYPLDTTPQRVDFTLANLDTVNGFDFQLKVTDNATGAVVAQSDQSTAQIVVDDAAGTGIGTASFIPAIPATDYRAVYTVEVAVRNHSADSQAADADALDLTTSWSFDSYLLYVYRGDALKLWIDGADEGGTATMSNWDDADALNPSTGDYIPYMTQDEILTLNGDIHLENAVSINFGDYAWKQLTDRIAWNNSNPETASLNYRQGSAWVDYANLYDLYAPGTQFELFGVKDGQTTLTATHELTGQSDSIDINVETLYNKLYLFRLTPGEAGIIKYTNGDGEQKVAETAADGQAAIYEPSGITGKVSFQILDPETALPRYIYSMDSAALASGETDAATGQLYPINAVDLHDVSTVDLYITGSFNSRIDELNIRGGVYIDGVFADQAFFNGATEMAGADHPLVIKPGADGHVKLTLDANQFYSEAAGQTSAMLTGDEKIEVILEITDPSDAHVPMVLNLVTSSGADDSIQIEDNAKVMTETSRHPQTYNSGKHPFYAAQSVALFDADGNPLGSDYWQDVTNFTGRIGPGNDFPIVQLDTLTLWWGEEPGKDYEVLIRDAMNQVTSGQTTQDITYPFSSIPVTRSSFIMDEDSIGAILGQFASTSPTIEYKEDGAQIRTASLPYQIMNMLVDAPGASKDTQMVNLLIGAISGQASSCDYAGGASCASISDSLVAKGMSRIAAGVDSKLLTVKLSPTADPTVFKAFIRAGFNLGGMTTNDVELTEENGTLVMDENGAQRGALGIVPPSGTRTTKYPEISDLWKMATGSYGDHLVDQTNKTAAEIQKSYVDKNDTLKKKPDGSVVLNVAGYAEGEVYYNGSAWVLQIRNGGFSAGGGYEYKWNYNTMVGPVPVTATFNLGASVDVNFNAAVNYESNTNDYLTQLRINAYFRAFGGVGFDVTICALKIGLFGQMNVENRFRILMEHDSGFGNLGYQMQINGQVGVEFVARFLFWSYDKILASKNFQAAKVTAGEWNRINEYWAEVGKGVAGNPDTILPSSRMARLMAYDAETGAELYASPSVTTVESRDYLSDYERSWNRVYNARTRAAGAGVALQDNAYPYAQPVVSEDGAILGTLSDQDSANVADTRAVYSLIDGAGNYSAPVVFPSPAGADDDGFGDVQLSLAGTHSLAAAAWTRLGLDAATDTSAAAQNAGVNSTEVLVSLWDGAAWTTTQLTDNETPDLAPVVARNDSGDVFVAWRAAYAVDGADPMNFDGSDAIMYRWYSAASGAWSEPQILYNGTTGAVNGLQADMLADGTAAVAFTLDTIGEADGSGFETVAVTVTRDAEGGADAVNRARFTSDANLDENPQLTSTSIDGTENFVLGWHNIDVATGEQDIKLRAFDGALILNPAMPESLAAMPNAVVPEVNSGFRFAKGAATIEDLSIVWSQNTGDEVATDEGELSADAFQLTGSMFIVDQFTGALSVSTPTTLAEMDEATAIDTFDVYVPNGVGDQVRSVLLSTFYDSSDLQETGYETTDDEGNTVPLYVPNKVSALRLADSEFTNQIVASNVFVDYHLVEPGRSAAVQASVTNIGLEDVTHIEFAIGDSVAVSDEPLAPGQTTLLVANPTMPTALTTLEYQVNATFASGGASSDAGQLHLDYPDVGITSLSVPMAADGYRTIEAHLSNELAIPLAGSGKSVKIGFFSDAEGTQPLNSYLSVPEGWADLSGEGENNGFTIPEDQLAVIDDAGFAAQFEFDIARYVADAAGVERGEAEIPESGVAIYAKTWIETPDPSAEQESSVASRLGLRASSDTEMITQRELDEVNNSASTTGVNLEVNAGTQVSVESSLSEQNGKSEAQVSLRNNSLASLNDGNVTVSLLDADGKVLETQQSYRTGDDGSLISLSGEGSASLNFQFAQKGVSVRAEYAEVDEGPSPSPTPTPTETPAPTTGGPTSSAPTTGGPTGSVPTTGGPTGSVPTSGAPTSEAPNGEPSTAQPGGGNSTEPSGTTPTGTLTGGQNNGGPESGGGGGDLYSGGSQNADGSDLPSGSEGTPNAPATDRTNAGLPQTGGLGQMTSLLFLMPILLTLGVVLCHPLWTDRKPKRS